MGQAVGVDALALVLDGQAGQPVPGGGGYGDAAAGRGVLDGVVHQDAQGLLGQAHVGPHGHRPLPPGGKGVGLVDHLGLLDHLGGHLGEIEHLHLDVHGVVVPPGQEEQLFHQLLHGGGLLLDGVNGLLPGGGIVLAPAVEQIGIALDHRDGGAQLVAGVGDKAHLGAVGRVDPVQHGVDGLGQGLQLLLGAGQIDAPVQVGGVDLVQLARQGPQLLRRHVAHLVEPGRRGGQFLDGPEHLLDGAGVFEQVGHQTGQLADEQHTGGEHEDGRRTAQIDLDGVGRAAIGQIEGIAGAPPGGEGDQVEEIRRARVEPAYAALGRRRGWEPAGQAEAEGRQCASSLGGLSGIPGDDCGIGGA